MMIPSIPQPWVSVAAMSVPRLLEELSVAGHDGHALVLLRIARHGLAADIEAAGRVLSPHPATDPHQHQRLLARGLEPVIRAGRQHDPLVPPDLRMASVRRVVAAA